jgi:spore germination cell wall hydrolase CwlJ-like protein
LNIETDVLAKTIYGEARGETLLGMESVASVVLNRLEISKRFKKYWWGNTIEEICLKSKQFSCWNKNDVNFAIINRVDENNPIFCICKRISKRAAAGLLADNTNRATHYHTKKARPSWTIGKIPCAEIGDHIFYNNIETLHEKK